MEGYEEWAPKAPPKTYGVPFIAMASGYISGHTCTITVNLNAASLEEAGRTFLIILGDMEMVNLYDYHITRKD